MVKCVLPSRRRNVQRFASFQIHPGRQNMQMDPTVLLPMQHRSPGIAVALQASKCDILKISQHLL